MTSVSKALPPRVVGVILGVLDPHQAGLPFKVDSAPLPRGGVGGGYSVISSPGEGIPLGPAEGMDFHC